MHGQQNLKKKKQAVFISAQDQRLSDRDRTNSPVWISGNVED